MLLESFPEVLGAHRFVGLQAGLVREPHLEVALPRKPAGATGPRAPWGVGRRGAGAPGDRLLRLRVIRRALGGPRASRGGWGEAAPSTIAPPAGRQRALPALAAAEGCGGEPRASGRRAPRRGFASLERGRQPRGRARGPVLEALVHALHDGLDEAGVVFLRPPQLQDLATSQQEAREARSGVEDTVGHPAPPQPVGALLA